MSTLLVATAAGVHAPLDGGVALDGEDVRGLAADGERVWAVTAGGRLFEREAGTWSAVADLGLSGVTTVAGAGDGTALVGSDPASLWRWDGAAAEEVTSFRSAPGAERWYTPWGGPAAVRSIAADDRVVLVNVHVGGVLRSADGGASWQPTIDMDDDVHQVVLASDGSLLAATGAAGFARSTDGGRSWAYDTDGLHGTYCRAVAVTGESVLVSSSAGPGARRGAVHRKPLEGSGFEKVSGGLPEWFGGNVDTGWIAARGSEAALAGPGGDVFVSGDEGRSWDHVASGLPQPRWLVLTA